MRDFTFIERDFHGRLNDTLHTVELTNELTNDIIHIDSMASSDSARSSSSSATATGTRRLGKRISSALKRWSTRSSKVECEHKTDEEGDGDGSGDGDGREWDEDQHISRDVFGRGDRAYLENIEFEENAQEYARTLTRLGKNPPKSLVQISAATPTRHRPETRQGLPFRLYGKMFGTRRR